MCLRVLALLAMQDPSNIYSTLSNSLRFIYHHTQLTKQPTNKKEDRECFYHCSLMFIHREPNSAESFGTSIGDMHCSHHMAVGTFDAFEDEPQGISYVHDVKSFLICHHIAMVHRRFQVDKMLILFLVDRPLHIFHLQFRSDSTLVVFLNQVFQFLN